QRAIGRAPRRTYKLLDAVLADDGVAQARWHARNLRRQRTQDRGLIARLGGAEKLAVGDRRGAHQVDKQRHREPIYLVDSHMSLRGHAAKVVLPDFRPTEMMQRLVRCGLSYVFRIARVASPSARSASDTRHVASIQAMNLVADGRGCLVRLLP